MRWLVLLLVVLCLTVGHVRAQDKVFNFGPGISKDMRTGDNMWNLGLQVQASSYLRSSGKLWYGLRCALNRWSYDEGEYPLKSGYTIGDSEGTQTLIEIVPSIRYPLSRTAFLRFGAGLFLISESDIKLDMSFSTPTSHGEEHVTMEGGSTIGFGLQPGVEFCFASISIVPIYTAYLREGDIYNHIAVTANLSLYPS